MVQANKEFVDDLGGYIYWAMDNHIPAEQVLFNLAHDINGAIKEDKYMVPRTQGYKKHLPNKTNEVDLILKTLLHTHGEPK